MAAKEIGKYVKVNKIALDYENPRHETLETPDEIIDHLCKKEDVLPLARDIARHGVNPLEMLAVMPGTKRGTFIAKEGNRRLCAIKLLQDPDLAPANLRKSFEKLAEQWTTIDELPVVIFDTQEEIDIWLQRIHNGANKGTGRKQWNAQQVARHTGESRNKLALAVLDYAEKKKFITADERKNRITTAQRFLGNPLMREAMGIDQSDLDGLAINRPEKDFDLLLKRFLGELVDDKSEKVNSRKNKSDIEAYGRELLRLKEVSGQTTEPTPVAPPAKAQSKPKKKTKPKVPEIPPYLPHDAEIESALAQLDNYKLITLYYSICDISLPGYTPLISVGLWAFVESLLAAIGSETDIVAFFSKNKLATYGFTKDIQNGGLRDAIARVARYGNTTKHDAKAATFDAKQLANDFETIAPLILKCVEDAISRKS